MPNWFEHGKHCFFFEVNDPASVQEALKTAQHYLFKEHEEERKAMARASYELARDYHRPKNYVKYALDICKQKLSEKGIKIK